MFYANLFISIITLICPFYLSATPVEAVSKNFQKAMIEDLESVKYSISINYGPADWKKEQFGWNLEKEFKNAKNRILNGNLASIRDYQKIFKDFILTTKDYHVNACFYSTECSFFPFSVKGARGRYFLTDVARNIVLSTNGDYCFEIDDVNKALIDRNLPKICAGDEILALDGKPIQQVIEELIDDSYGGDRSPTGYSLAEKTLFFRRGKYGHSIPTGTFEILLNRKGKKEPFTCRLPWYHVSEWVANHLLKNQLQKECLIDASKVNLHPMQTIQQLLAKDFTVSVAKDLLTGPSELINFAKDTSSFKLTDDNEEKETTDLRVKGFLPPLGRRVWESSVENRLYAYLYKHPSGKRVGYIHLPTFYYEKEVIDVIMSELIDIIQRLNSESEALVFDVTNNPGGNLMFMYAVMSCLISKPMKVTMHRELITQEDVYSASVLYNQLKNYQSVEDIGTIAGYHFDQKVIELLKQYASVIIRTWESGQRFTPLLFLNGIDEVMPHPEAQYKKPIIILTNEFDFSCADFFPAIMQDNKRAKIFGQRTAGAGGHVKSYLHNSRFGIQGYSLTASIAYRPDGSLIENAGVSPDVPYVITEKDIRSGYKGYMEALNQEISSLFK